MEQNQENNQEQEELSFEELIKKDYENLKNELVDLQRQITEQSQVLVDMKVQNDDLKSKNKDLMSIIRYNGAGAQDKEPIEEAPKEEKILSQDDILSAFNIK